MIDRLEDITIEHLYLDALPDEISHLAAHELLQVIYDYKSDMTVKEILHKYSIDIKPSKLKKFLPLILNGVCEFCGGKIGVELESKTSRYGLLDQQSSQCISCGHKPLGYRCNCKSCLLLQEEQRIYAEAKKAKIIELKMEVIQSQYNFEKFEYIDENDLDFKDKVFLSVILRSCLSEDGKYIKPIQSSVEPISSSQDLTTKIIRGLTSKGIIVPSVKSEIEAFSFDESNESAGYYIYLVKYLLNIRMEDKYSLLIERLLYLTEDIHQHLDDFLEIWKDLAFHEVMSYYLNQMAEVGYEPSIGEITKTTFQKLLENFSVGQIFNIIFRAVANSTKAYQSREYSKKHAMNMVVASCRNQGERAIAEHWDLKSYGRIKQLPESELSRLLFTSLLKKPNQGFYNAPTRENLKKLINEEETLH